MRITLFTDGSSRGNPGNGGYAAVIVVEGNSVDTVNGYNESKVIELGGYEKLTTNNRMEMTGVLRGLEYIATNFIANLSAITAKNVTITVVTDSAYVLNGSTKWIHGWKKTNWISSQKQEVLNRDLWEQIADVLGVIEEKTSIQPQWKLIKGHSGISLNERCDVIATSYADSTPAALYKGFLVDYPYRTAYEAGLAPSSSVDSSVSSRSSAKKSRSVTPAYSYVSSVDGIIETHSDWKSCEARVKGASGARFKKALNATEEQQIKKEFSAN